MTATEPQPAAPKPKRRWFQYSLRTLLLFMLLVSIGMSWVAVKMQQARRQKEAVEAIEKVGGGVIYDYQVTSATYIPATRPRGPAWIRSLLGEDLFRQAFYVFLDGDQEAGLEQLKRLPYLQGLSLTRLMDSELEHVKGHLKGLTQLATLDLRYTQVTDASLNHLKELTQLQTLYLGGTKVTDEGVKKLQQALPNCEIER